MKSELSFQPAIPKRTHSWRVSWSRSASSWVLSRSRDVPPSCCALRRAYRARLRLNFVPCNDARCRPLLSIYGGVDREREVQSWKSDGRCAREPRGRRTRSRLELPIRRRVELVTFSLCSSQLLHNQSKPYTRTTTTQTTWTRSRTSHRR